MKTYEELQDEITALNAKVALLESELKLFETLGVALQDHCKPENIY